MPDPNTLEIGDKVTFTSLPAEWNGSTGVLPEDIEFMKKVVALGEIYNVYEIDEHGARWVEINLPTEQGIEEHTWAIFESSGWQKVED